MVKKLDGTWEAMIGTVPLEVPRGTTKAEAMVIVERAIEARMAFALEEWHLYLAAKSRAQRTPSGPESGNP